MSNKTTEENDMDDKSQYYRDEHDDHRIVLVYPDCIEDKHPYIGINETWRSDKGKYFAVTTEFGEDDCDELEFFTKADADRVASLLYRAYKKGESNAKTAFKKWILE